MTWQERALLITAVSVGFANLGTGLFALLRACQAFKILKRNTENK